MGIFGAIGAALLRTALGMLASLLSEKFLKDLAIMLLSKLEARVESEALKQVIKDVEEAWKAMPASSDAPKLG